MSLRMTSVLLVACSALAPAAVPAAEDALIAFRLGDSQVEITIGGAPLATYVFAGDDAITRPYLAHVHAPGGIQVTRNHPPVEGVDATDHATFHPGIWLAFGAIGENDYWRNKARVVHDGFVEEPAGGANARSFAVRNLYLDERDPDQVVCREVGRLKFLVRPAGCLIVWDSTFSSDRPFTFGDQEEMGLGVRVATPITESNGGTLRDSEGRTTAAEIWGNTAAWCDYSGRIGDAHAGVAIFCHRNNFRPSWMHVRDYGLMAANAFGRAAFGKGPESRVTVQPGESLRLRYGILLHGSPADGPPVDVAAAYEDYLRVAGS